MTVAASTPGTTTSNSCIRLSSQHGAFYAAGRYWIFYIDATEGDIYYRTSTDGSNWSSATLAASAVYGGATFDVVFDGTYVHYARNYDYVGGNYYGLKYRRGTPQSDGSISWSAVEQTVINSAYVVVDIQLAVDSGGYPWVGYGYGAYWYPTIIKSSTNDGTWSTASGFPHQFFATNYWFVIPVPQTSGKVYCLVYRALTTEETIKGYAWDGSWGSQETATVTALSNGAGDGYYGMLSAVAVGDDIHLVFMASDEDIKYVKRTSGSWGSESTVEGTTCVAYSSPVLTKKSDDDLICFWLHSDDKVYYKQYINGSWDAGPTELIDETADDFIYEYLIQAYYEELGGYLGVIYQTKTSSPYNIRHAILELAITLQLESLSTTRAALALTIPEAPTRYLTEFGRITINDLTEFGRIISNGITEFGRIVFVGAISLACRSSTDIRAAIILDTSVSFSLKSSTDTRAAITLTVTVITELSLRSSTDTRAALSLDTGIALALRSSTDTRASLALEVVLAFALRSSTDTRAALELNTLIGLALRSQTDTRANLALTVTTSLALRSVSDTRANLALSTLISLELRSSTSTRAAIALTIVLVTELELRSATATRAAIQLDTVISLALLSQTDTRADLILTAVFRHQAIIMAMLAKSLTLALPDRDLIMAIPSRSFDMKVRQDG